jgi:SAM-dependent methyltransferase
MQQWSDAPRILVRKARSAILLLLSRQAGAQAALQRQSWENRYDVASFESYFGDQDAPHRSVIADILEPLDPSSVYEFGCYSAPTLKLLRRRFPSAALYGTDINPHAIAYAAERLPDLHLARADDRSTAFLAGWLPERIDVAICSSVLYTMSERQVGDLLSFLARRSRHILIGCNLSNYDGRKTTVAGGSMQHAYGRLFHKLGLDVISRAPSPKQDNSISEFILVRPKGTPGR